MKRGLQEYLLPHKSPGETFHVFVPADLPPSPPLDLDSNLFDLMEKANRALGRLDGISSILPEISLFLYFYIRKEAVLSSQIEGTQSSLSDLLLFESDEVPGVPLDDVQEVSNYVSALNYGIAALRNGEPITLRLLRSIHNELLAKGRGSDKNPGEFRQSQNWVHGSRPGNALYVPPPPYEVNNLMNSLANFIHDRPDRTPALIKAALAHVQFETIHPFLDGNGRLGRLLITLMLCQEEAIREPLLYMSLYFRVNRDEYYRLLQKVRNEGDWEEWLAFFLTGVQTTADQAAGAAQQILKLFEADQRQIGELGRQAGSILRVHHILQRRPLVTISEIAKQTGLTKPTIHTCLTQLEGLGIIRQRGVRIRNRVFVYEKYLEILNEGTELKNKPSP